MYKTNCSQATQIFLYVYILFCFFQVKKHIIQYHKPLMQGAEVLLQAVLLSKREV